MPGLDGFEVCRRRLRFTSVPIVMSVSRIRHRMSRRDGFRRQPTGATAASVAAAALMGAPSASSALVVG